MAEQDQNENTGSRGKGCLFWGTMIFIGLGVVFILVVGGGIWYAKGKLDEAVNTYTSESAKDVESYEATPEEAEKAQSKIKDLRSAAEKGRAQTFKFTDREINTLISESPKLKDTVYVDLEGTKIHATISMPLNKKHFGGLATVIGEDRYLNGKATFRVENTNERPELYAQKLSVKGKNLPKDFMKRLRKHDFAEVLYDSEKFQKIRQKLDSVKVEDGQVIVRTAGE